MKRPSPQRMADMKEELYRDLARGDIDIREASRRIRRILGMSQKDYALKVAKISPRILSEFEKGTGNPTLSTLQKIGSPLGLQVSFLPPEHWYNLFEKQQETARITDAETRGQEVS
jgi:transcriptional regulator with XRE-family HTH domain